MNLLRKIFRKKKAGMDGESAFLRGRNKFYSRYRNNRAGEFVAYLHRTCGYSREIETN